MSRKPYKEILSDGWNRHLERKENAPTVISTFAGMGCSSLGYSMAGFKERLAVEWDDHSVEVFKRNFPKVPVFHGDIAKLSCTEVFKLTGLKQGELDVFDGSPPCQGFSIAGHTDPTDERNQLFREYVRLLKGLQAKVFVMENVPNMISEQMKPIFLEMVEALKSCGYSVKAKIVEAQYYFVPQTRKRLILIGTRNDLGKIPVFPARQSTPISCLEALRNVDESEEKRFLDLSQKIASSWPLLKPGDRYNRAYWHGTQTTSGAVKLDPIKPCPTITKTGGNRGAFASITHWNEPRLLTIAEAKRLMSIPDECILEGKYLDCWARIGNGVPPFMMKAIAETIRTQLLN